MIVIKLLVIARDYRRFVSRQVTYHLIMELAKITDLVVWHERGDDIHKILNQLEIEPDFILILEYFETNASKITGLSSLSIPFAISLQDLHWDIEYRKELIRAENIQYIFSACRDGLYKLYPELRNNLLWLPHNVNTYIFKDYGLEKDIDYLLMGLVSKKYYPLRYKVFTAMENRPGFVFHKHPGYREIGEDEDIFVREKYAREINRAKIFFTCDGIYHYPIAKYFEVLACNTLLLAPSSPEIEDLGFLPGIHFVAIDEYDFVEKAEYYLAHEKERLEIAQQGYEMVRTRHSSARRAEEIVTEIKHILSMSAKGSNLGGNDNE